MEAVCISQPFVPSAIRHPRLDEITSYPRPRYKGHWAMGSGNIEESNRFYEALTGTQLICRPANFSKAISWDDEHHRFFIMDVTAMKKNPDTGEDLVLAKGTPQDRTGVGIGTIRYASPQALVRVYRQMQKAGWEPARIVDRGATLELIYADPDNSLIEAFAVNPGVSAQAASELTIAEFLHRFG